MTTTQAQVVLQDSRSKLFYNKNLGGFSESNIDLATCLDAGTSQPAFIKAHFQNPQFIIEVEFEETPTPENAHFNKHLNGSIRPVKVYHSGSSRTYRFGDWSIEVCSRTESRLQGCGYRKSRTVTNFDLRNSKIDTYEYMMIGGLKKAVAKIIRHEMNRHGIA